MLLLLLLIKLNLLLLLLSARGGVTVRYSLLFETSSPPVSDEDPEEAGPVAGETVSLGDDPGLRDLVAKALRQDASLPIDMDSLRFTPTGRQPKGRPPGSRPKGRPPGSRPKGRPLGSRPTRVH